MELQKIRFNITMDGLTYGCKATPATHEPVTGYVLSIYAMDHLYRLDMQLDVPTQSFIISNCNTADIPPEIMELEFKISGILCHNYIL